MCLPGWMVVIISLHEKSFNLIVLVSLYFCMPRIFFFVAFNPLNPLTLYQFHRDLLSSSSAACASCLVPCGKQIILKKYAKWTKNLYDNAEKKSSYKYQQKFHPPQWFMFDGGKIFCLLKLFLLLPIKGSFISQRCRCQCKG